MCPQDEAQTEVVETAETQVAGEGAQTSTSGDADGAAAQTDEGGASANGDATAAAAVAAAVFKANHKIKVMDEEKEIPEEFRSLMKDEASEKKVREVFEKYFGHEHTKPKYEALKTNFSQLQSEHNSLNGQIGELREMYKRGDLDSFFERLAIPPQRILQYALEKINYQELPPEQKQALDARRSAERQNFELQRANQTMQQQFQEQIVQARRVALDSELDRPEIKPIASAFDQRLGQPGAFKREIISRGQLAWLQSQGKVDLPPGQAVEQVIAMYGLRTAPASAAPGSTAPAGAGQTRANTIPNVGGGRSGAPVKQKPRSIEDLKKMAAEM